jgi:WhiB family redox-sensing transcriptional regulator
MMLPPLPSGGRTTFPTEGWDWLAACKGRTQEMFAHSCNRHCFRTGGRTCMKSDQVAYSRGICEACPVLVHCRMWALESQPSSGMAGAMTEAERMEFHESRGNCYPLPGRRRRYDHPHK